MGYARYSYVHREVDERKQINDTRRGMVWGGGTCLGMVPAIVDLGYKTNTKCSRNGRHSFMCAALFFLFEESTLCLQISHTRKINLEQKRWGTYRYLPSTVT